MTSNQRFGAGIWHFATYVDRYATDGYGEPRTILDAIDFAGTVGDLSVVDLNYPFFGGDFSLGQVDEALRRLFEAGRGVSLAAVKALVQEGMAPARLMVQMAPHRAGHQAMQQSMRHHGFLLVCGVEQVECGPFQGDAACPCGAGRASLAGCSWFSTPA